MGGNQAYAPAASSGYSLENATAVELGERENDIARCEVYRTQSGGQQSKCGKVLIAPNAGSQSWLGGTGPRGEFIPPHQRSGAGIGEPRPNYDIKITEIDDVKRLLELRSTGNPDVFTREGFSGRYLLQQERDGSLSIFYTGGGHTSGMPCPIQTFHHGAWDKSRTSRLSRRPETAQPIPSKAPLPSSTTSQLAPLQFPAPPASSQGNSRVTSPTTSTASASPSGTTGAVGTTGTLPATGSQAGTANGTSGTTEVSLPARPVEQPSTSPTAAEQTKAAELAEQQRKIEEQRVEEIKRLEAALAAANAEAEESTSGQAELKQKVEQLTQQLAEQQKKQQENQGQQERQEEQRRAATLQRQKELEAERESAKQELQSWATRFSKLHEQFNGLQAESTRSQANWQKQLDSQVSQNQTEQQQASAELSVTKEQLASLKEQLEELQKSLAEETQKRKDSEAAKEQLAQQTEEQKQLQQQEREAAQQELEKLLEQLANLKEALSTAELARASFEQDLVEDRSDPSAMKLTVVAEATPAAPGEQAEIDNYGLLFDQGNSSSSEKRRTDGGQGPERSSTVDTSASAPSSPSSSPSDNRQPEADAPDPPAARAREQERRRTAEKYQQVERLEEIIKGIDDQWPHERLLKKLPFGFNPLNREMVEREKEIEQLKRQLGIPRDYDWKDIRADLRKLRANPDYFRSGNR